MTRPERTRRTEYGASQQLLAEEVPSATRYGGLGGLLPIFGRNTPPLEYIAGLLKEHGGLVRIRIRGITHNYTSDADVVQELLARPEDFPKSVAGSTRGQRGDLLRGTLGSGLATARDGEEIWHIAHRLLALALAPSALNEYFPKMLTIVDELLERQEFGNKTISVVNLMERIAFEIMSYVGFHTRFFRTDTDDPVPFVEALRNVLRDTWKGQRRVLPAVFYPVAKRKRRRADATLSETLDAIICERRAAFGRGATTNDILQRMLTGRDAVTGKSLPDENIRYQLLTFLGASLETTAGALSYALHDLATHPEIGERLSEEVDGVLSTESDREPTAADMSKLKYTERIFKEVLRLHPPGPTIFRHVARNTVIAGKYPVHQKEKIVVLMTFLHRNPLYWREPDRFDPERFLPDAVSARHSHAYLPFGFGMRHCTGFQFATMEAKLVLARLYQRFVPRLEDPSYTLRDVYTDSAKPASFRLCLEPRAQR